MVKSQNEVLATAPDNSQMLVQMDAAADAFYRSAVGIGNHAFIEFTGLMKEYVNICRAAHEEGIDFSISNRHSGRHLKVEPFQLDYIVEKLDCIFGSQLTRNKERFNGKS